MSMKISIFQSCYQDFNLKKCTYLFGIDPFWGKTENELNFLNSFKMKLAVILGVFQMLLGIILKGINCILKQQWIDFFFEFLPQFIFMSLIFGYMDFLIFYKWSLDFQVQIIQPPSIIAVLIDMGLYFGKVKGDTIIQDQELVQVIFLVLAILCVPLMLFPKPIILYFQKQQILLQQNKQNQEQINLANDLERAQISLIRNTHEQELLSSSNELFVHQVIETIEFVIGSVSNTASYLRLWALSLAHSQLAFVFFDKIIKYWIESGNIFMLIISFYLFSIITIGILMFMDVMECFLHALRLHWVEFQNKFYKADGYLFEPISFQQIILNQQFQSQ
ncbi:v-type ATPase 116kda subunit family protein, putative [Ichthyophthirius multifiliis]|uniref:V-type proton ATPase subunit a n=1 Tax=Ichthyophthirius multifiliis TaxID=5932 RepID=G0R2F3_ICHMU|nr:v-type ATPase 116kda subunit family protein, putative [Ichthyophthirius multifiliis]EGR28351.1 v-type ATPase 116kda subunit family protein, putative [Ichthyophthirius multifiliis]|eukprot:XP_004027696.1 v-type ATPase 116kda subunit family protein, putative [Ichthyophthirius multifiliis]